MDSFSLDLSPGELFFFFFSLSGLNALSASDLNQISHQGTLPERTRLKVFLDFSV